MSAAYKYAAMMLFCIPTEGDNDADSQTHEIVAKAPPISNAQNRAPYEKISAGIRQITTTGTNEDLTAWYKSHAPAIEKFNPSWNDEIMAEFTNARETLKAKQP